MTSTRGRRDALAIAVVTVFVGLGGWIAVGSVAGAGATAFVVASPPGVVANGSSVAVHGGASLPELTITSAPGGVAGSATGNADRVDPAWSSRTAAATGIPLRVLQGYAGAELAMAAEAPGCGIAWTTLAALGGIESAHGTHAGSAVGDDGVARPGIFGIDLTGESSARITDTDGGLWDGKPDIDRAIGPMQFIPATWETWGADGNGDGVRDPQQIDDAALAAARYLCHYGDLRSVDTWRTAIYAYNHLDSYVNAVAHAANAYAERAR